MIERKRDREIERDRAILRYRENVCFTQKGIGQGWFLENDKLQNISRRLIAINFFVFVADSFIWNY